MRYILVSSVRTMGTETPEFHFDEDGRVVIWRKGASHVVTEILSNKYITTDELAAKFNVSERTVRRDFNVLRKSYTIQWVPLFQTIRFWRVEKK